MDKFSKALAYVEEVFVGIGIIVPSIVLFINVVLRYVFNSGWIWAEESARYMIVWMVFVGASACVRKGMHLAVDAAIIRLSNRSQAVVKVIVSVICIGFSFFLVYYGWEICSVLKDTEQTTPGLEIPVYWVYLAIPTGGLLMGFRFFEEMLRNIKALSATS